MKIIFFGSGKFAVKILDALIMARHDVILIVTQPDRQKGRHLHLTPTPVKEFSLTKNLEIFQPVNINDQASVAFLKNRPAEIYVVVSYGRILSKEVLALPLKMPVNIHGSLLPKYRGAAPINRALMNGESISGVTFIKMNERMDQGDILLAKSLKILKSDDVVSLDEKLSTLAAQLINKVLAAIDRGRARLKKQSEKNATLAPLMTKHDGLINWTNSSRHVMNQYRGCMGWPGTYTLFRKKILKILSLEKGRHKVQGKPGEIIQASHQSLEVACGQGSLIIKEVVPESHKKMTVQSFLAGHQVKIGEILG